MKDNFHSLFPNLKDDILILNIIGINSYFQCLSNKESDNNLGFSLFWSEIIHNLHCKKKLYDQQVIATFYITLNHQIVFLIKLN